jgi:hypothetical protein
VISRDQPEFSSTRSTAPFVIVVPARAPLLVSAGRALVRVDGEFDPFRHRPGNAATYIAAVGQDLRNHIKVHEFVAFGEAAHLGLRDLAHRLSLDLEERHVGFLVPIEGGLGRAAGAIESDFMSQHVSVTVLVVPAIYYVAKRRTTYKASSSFDGGDREGKGFREEN